MRVPKLRAVEVITITDEANGKSLVLRDTEGVATGQVVVPIALSAIVGRFDGVRTVDQIAAEATRALRRPVARSLVERLAAELDEALMLESARFRAAKRQARRAFAESPVRAAKHAGGAYHADPSALDAFIRDECFGRARAHEPLGRLRGLCAPHMDLWRASVGYGHAYATLRDAMPDEVDTVVLLGTCHALMRAPFALCDKAFATPFGPLEPDADLIARIARRARFDVFEDEYLHKAEHSLEFQAVFLRYLSTRAFEGERERPLRIVPVLCGLGSQQSTGRDPARDAAPESFVEALIEVVDELGPRALVIAGADLAHVGPRFGDPRPLDESERNALAARDHESIELARRGEAKGFWSHVAEDLDTRRVCGLAPMYTMLRVLGAVSASSLLNYEQCVDPGEGSIVSHASIAYYA